MLPDDHEGRLLRCENERANAFQNERGDPTFYGDNGEQDTASRPGPDQPSAK